MRIGFSDSFNSVLLNLDQNQATFANLTKQLSSGLRINSAADDPSGLAIAEKLQSVSNGLQQGITSVQTANNALTVADGGLATITEILQRARSLVVEANSDLNSADNLAAIQTEINQLLLEVNRIAANTNFNGLNLLDGSLSNQQATAEQNLFVSNPLVNGGTQQLLDPTQTNGSPYTEAVQFSFSIDSYDATTGQIQVTATLSSPDPSFGPTQTNVLHVTPGTNYFVEYGPGVGPYTYFDNNGNPVFQFNFNNITTADVGQTGIVVTIPPQSATNGHPLEVNTGTSEGSTIAISIGGVSTNNLGIGETQVGDLLTNQASEARLDNAITTVVGERAQLGAQMVSLNEAANDASIQVVNQTASESSIRDLNIGTATTQFTRAQILVSVGTSVLSQMEVSTQALTSIVLGGLR